MLGAWSARPTMRSSLPVCRLALLAIAALVLLAATATEARSLKSRHPSLDPLTTSDRALSAHGKARHSAAFHRGLVTYAQHLDTSADLMLLQASAIERHEGQAEHEVDEGADTDAETETETETTALSTLSQPELSARLAASFSAGDAADVAHVLEHRANKHLSPEDRSLLAMEVVKTMHVVDKAVTNHETLDGTQLVGMLDALIDNVNPTPDWVSEALSEATKTMDTATATQFRSAVVAATNTAIAGQTDVAGDTSLDYHATMTKVLTDSLSNLSADTPIANALRTAAATTTTTTSAADFAKSILTSSIQKLVVVDPTDKAAEADAALATDAATTSTTDTPAWMATIIAQAAKDIDSDNGELSQSLRSTAEDFAILHPAVEPLITVTNAVFNNVDDHELEARVRFQARAQVFQDMIQKEKDGCDRVKARGGKCDLAAILEKTTDGMKSLLKGELPDTLTAKADDPISSSDQLDIARTADTTPESMRDMQASIKGGVDPWGSLPGRAGKTLVTKDKTVLDLLDGEADRCPKKCSLHGQCLMDMDSVVKSPSGAQNVHPFHCICDTGYVGEACQIKLDMHLRWLLTEGAAPFPKCCAVCEKQRVVPDRWDDIPTYNNPFAAFEPACQPWPRISLYSREDGSHEMIKGRRPDPKCSHPLGEITHADPLVAIELATDLSVAQGILTSGLLTNMDYLSASHGNMHTLSHEARAQHANQLRTAARTLKDASETAKKAALALQKKLRLTTPLGETKFGSIDLAALLEDFREMPNKMDECCIFCQLDKEPEPFVSNFDPAANTGAPAILSQDPNQDNEEDKRNRRMALAAQDRRRAAATGGVSKADEDCCIVCPYNFREMERLEEAAYVRKINKGKSSSSASEDKKEMDAVFLETFAQVDSERRRRHEPLPCCAACPSQFLIAHAFPSGPWTTTRTMPNGA